MFNPCCWLTVTRIESNIHLFQSSLSTSHQEEPTCLHSICMKNEATLSPSFRTAFSGGAVASCSSKVVRRVQSEISDGPQHTLYSVTPPDTHGRGTGTRQGPRLTFFGTWSCLHRRGENGDLARGTVLFVLSPCYHFGKVLFFLIYKHLPQQSMVKEYQ